MVKTELYYDWEGDDPDIFERDLEKYIDWYNNVRIKRRLDGSSPVEYRLSRPLDSLLLPFRKRGPLQNSDGLNKDYATRDWLRNSSGVSPSSLTWRYRVFQWTTYASRFAFKSSKSGASSPDGPRPPLKDSKSGHVPLKDLKSGHVLP